MFIPTSSIAIIAHGQIDITEVFEKRIQSFSRVYLVDGGANYFFQLYQKKSSLFLPQAIIGDFDSIEPHVLDFYKNHDVMLEKLDRAKDKTDLEAAIEKIIGLYPKEKISIFGGFGKRVDHTLSNLFLLSKFYENIFFESENEILFLIMNTKQKITLAQGQTLSLIPLFGPCKVTTNGLKWELKEHILDFAAISNISLEGSCLIEVSEGSLVCIINRYIDQEMLSLEDKTSTASFCRVYP